MAVGTSRHWSQTWTTAFPRVSTVYRNKVYLRFWASGVYSWEELHPETEHSKKVHLRKPWYLTYKREGKHFRISSVKAGELSSKLLGRCR